MVSGMISIRSEQMHVTMPRILTFARPHVKYDQQQQTGRHE
jgi:hypothetical protein